MGRALAGLPDSVNSWAGGRVRGWERGQRAAVSLTLPPDRPGSTSDDFCARGIFGCPAIAVAEARENSEAGEEGGGKCHRKERRGPASSPESWKSADGAQQGGRRAPGLAHSSSAAPPPTSPTVGSCSPRPTMRMQSACRMQRWVQGVRVLSAW